MGQDNELLIRINGTAKDFLKEIDRVTKKTEDLQKSLQAVAKGSAIAFAGLTAAAVIVTKSFIDFEKALVGVGKTANLDGVALQNFGKKIQSLSQDLPVATNELLGIAQAGAQLGIVGEKNLLKFTTTIAKLGVATDLSGEQAATALTRILNVTGETIDTIDVFGSVIVALGNSFAATESEIVKVTTEVARSTSVFGVSSAEAAALAASLKSVGVQAQLGGSAIGRAFREIDKAIRKGGTSLDDLAKITGIAADELENRFGRDAVGVFKAFTEGLGAISKAGGSTTEALAKFGLKGDEILKVLPVLAQNSELLGRALNLASKEVNNATALNEEAAKAFATLGSEQQKLTNVVVNFATAVGAELAPAVKSIIQGLASFFKLISGGDGTIAKIVANILKFGIVTTGLITAAALAGLAYLKFGVILVATKTVIIGSTVVQVALTAAQRAFALSSAFAAAAVAGLRTALLLLTGPLGFLVALLGVLALAFREEVGDALKFIADFSKDVFVRFIEGVKNFTLRTVEGFKTIFRVVSASLSGIGSAIGTFVDFVATKFGALGDIIKGALTLDFDVLTKGLDTLKGQVGTTFADIGKNAVEAFNASILEGDEVSLPGAEAEGGGESAAAKKLRERLALEADIRRQDREERAEFAAEFDEIETERLDALSAQDRERLTSDLITAKEAKRLVAIEQVKTEIAARNKFLKDTEKHGVTVAKLNRFLDSEEVKGASSAANQLVKLSQSKNSTLQAIGKAAALVRIGVDTAQGAIGAFSSLSSIPIVGPALGLAAAAALIAFGAEQAINVVRAQRGGIVPAGPGGARDRVPALLEPGELVVPAAITSDFIQSVGRPEVAIDDEGGGVVQEVLIRFADNAFDIIEQGLQERSAIGSGGL